MKYRGRPARFEDPDEMQRQIDLYFQDCKEEKEVPTVSGLAVYLGTNRQTLIRYEKNDECGWLVDYPESVRVAFRDTIKEAKARIESGYEQQLFNKQGVVGAIFTLKNNYGYVDKQEVEQTTKTINVDLED